MIKVEKQKKWLALTSLILSIIGLLLSMTLIRLVLWFPIALVWLIFGIVALVKKQKKGLAIAGIVMSGIVVIMTAIFSFFLIKYSDSIIEPIKEITALMENDPELAKLMTNKDFSNEFQTKLQEVLIQKLATDTPSENWENEDTLWIPMIMEEMKNLLYDLKDEYTQNQ